MNQLMDVELVQLAQEGKSEAFDALVKRYQNKVTQLVYRYVHDNDTALDLVQDIFFKIFRNLGRFKGECAFSTWMYRIAVNDCIDHTRRLKVRQETSLDQLAEVGFDAQDTRKEADVWASVQERIDSAMVRQALESLPNDQRSVLVLKVFEEMTFEQIASILGEPISTIKSRLYKALELLGRQFRQQQFLERFKK
ncbi:MAG: sigma-70 family RNA polymerase sigma factor [Acidobacteria bacterium]|nr:sigma-70 family RNA polymerase sigma factor [Acidobacteriota bacterium]MCB9398319.1 sigma-70 family RNA polymerase sigma factor [Acidobacteriota bacterium]